MSATATTAAAAAQPAARSRLARLFTSTIGLKLIMAVTGVVGCLFVLGHMAGNLQAFQGATAFNDYAIALRKFPALLWAARIGLLLAVGLHIWAYWMTSQKSWAARPEGYRVTAYKESSWASRTMRWTGPFLGVFIVYHLLHLTLGTVHPSFQEMNVADGNVTEAFAYENLVSGLQQPAVAVFYLLAMLALGVHLWHGVWSLFQTLGVSQPRYASIGRRIATLFTILVVGGFAAIPLAVLAGVLK